MADTTFVSKRTVITTDWAQDVNDHVYGDSYKHHGIRMLEQPGADPTGVTDMTNVLIAAIATAKANGINAVECSGGKWRIDLGQIDLENITLYSDAPPDFGSPYGDIGAVFLLTSLTNSPFVLKLGWAIRGITFYWPSQDNSAAPIAYPPLFKGGYSAGGVMEDIYVVNAYRFVHFEDVYVIGNIRMHRCLVYAIDRIFWFEVGAADVFHLTDCYFSRGTWWPASTPNTYARDHSDTQGEFMRVDIGSSAYTSIDGFNMRGTIVYGYRYGIRLLSGAVNVSSVEGCWFDACQTALSVEGTAVVNHSRWADNYHWSAPSSGATSTEHPTMSFTSTGVVGDIYISDNDFVYGLGDHIYINGLAVDDIQIQGNRFRHWGLNTTSAATNHYAIALSDASANGTISTNTFRAWPTSIHYSLGIIITNNEDLNIANNEFEGCYLPLWLENVARATVISNTSRGTTWTAAMRNDNAAGLVESVANRWDKSVTGPTGFSAVHATAGTQTFTGAKTQVTYGTEVLDMDENFASNTFTAPTAGLYAVEAFMNNTTGVTATNVWALTVEQAGGASNMIGASVYVPADVVGAAPLSCAGTFSLAAGDTIKVYLTRTTGAGNYVSINDATYNFLTIRRAD
jgi:hypothetical protein